MYRQHGEIAHWDMGWEGYETRQVSHSAPYANKVDLDHRDSPRRAASKVKGQAGGVCFRIAAERPDEGVRQSTRSICTKIPAFGGPLSRLRPSAGSSTLSWIGPRRAAVSRRPQYIDGSRHCHAVYAPSPLAPPPPPHWDELIHPAWMMVSERLPAL